MSEDQKNEFEVAVREIVTLFLKIGTMDTMSKFMSISNLAVGMLRFFDVVKGWDKPIIAEQLRLALDGMIGTEPDALIGPNEGALLKFDLGPIDVEKLTDLIFESVAAYAAETA